MRTSPRLESGPIRGTIFGHSFSEALSSFDITETGNLTNKTTIAEFGTGTLPDDLAFDADGGLCVTSIVSDRIIRVAAGGPGELVSRTTTRRRLTGLTQHFRPG